MNNQDPSHLAGNQLHTPLPPMESLPELTGFLSADVSASPEAQQNQGGPTAGEIEYARTLVAGQVYDRLYGDPAQDSDPSYMAEDYKWIVEAQHVGKGDERKLRPGHLTPEEFAQRRQELREAFPDQESWDAVRYVTAIHDIFKKRDNMYAVGLTPGVHSHDEGLPRLFLDEYADARAQILPTYADPDQFTDRQREIIKGASSVRGVNWPGIMQSQAPAAVFGNIPQDLDPQTLEAFITHAEADVAGAAGHINPNGSLTMDSSTSQRMRMLRLAVRQGGTPQEISDNFLSGCAHEIYGVDTQNVPDLVALDELRATTRIANDLRTPNPDKYAKIVDAFNGRDANKKATIQTVLNATGVDDRAPNLEFLPAVLLGVEKSHGLEKAVDYLATILGEASNADFETGDRTPGVYEVNLEALAKAAQRGELDPDQRLRFALQNGVLIPEFASPDSGS